MKLYQSLMLWCCSGLCLASAGAQTPKSKMTKISFTAVACKYQDCPDRDHHGNIRIVYSDGKTETVTTTADCVGHEGEEANPKLSPDHTTAGWLQGEHVAESDGRYFAGTRLVLYRDGHVVNTIDGDRYFVEAWCFWNGGKQIILQSRATHGIATIELHDAKTGREIARVDEWRVTKNSPLWEQKLTGPGN